MPMRSRRAMPGSREEGPALGLDYRAERRPAGADRVATAARTRLPNRARCSRSRRSSGATTTWVWLRGRSPIEPADTPRLGTPSGSRSYLSAAPRTDAAPDVGRSLLRGTRSSRSQPGRTLQAALPPPFQRSRSAQVAVFGEADDTAPTVETLSSPRRRDHAVLDEGVSRSGQVGLRQRLRGALCPPRAGPPVRPGLDVEVRVAPPRGCLLGLKR